MFFNQAVNCRCSVVRQPKKTSSFAYADDDDVMLLMLMLMLMMSIVMVMMMITTMMTMMMMTQGMMLMMTALWLMHPQGCVMQQLLFSFTSSATFAFAPLLSL